MLRFRSVLPACLLPLAAAGGFNAGADDAPIRLSDAKSGQPQVAVTSDGRAYVVWAEGDAILCAASPKVGDLFAKPVKAGEVAGLMKGMRRGPRVAAAGKGVVVTGIGRAKGDLLAWRSEDGGATWSGPATVNGKQDAAREGLSDLAAGSTAPTAGGASVHFHAAWLDLREGKTQIWAAVSDDGGKTWKETRVYQSPSGTVCECCHPSIAADGKGKVWILFRNSLEGNRDMYLATSADGGDHWPSPARLGTDSWKLGRCPMAGGALAVAGGNPAQVWTREEDIFLTDPAGRSRKIGRGRSPWAAEGPGGTYVVWRQSGEAGKVILQRPGGKPEVLSDDGSYPVIAGNLKAGVIAAWETSAGVFVQTIAKGK